MVADRLTWPFQTRGFFLPATQNGVVTDSEGHPKQYSAKFFTLDKTSEKKWTEAKKLPSYKLLSIDGIPVSISYQNGEFLISKGR